MVAFISQNKKVSSGLAETRQQKIERTGGREKKGSWQTERWCHFDPTRNQKMKRQVLLTWIHHAFPLTYLLYVICKLRYTDIYICVEMKCTRLTQRNCCEFWQTMLYSLLTITRFALQILFTHLSVSMRHIGSVVNNFKFYIKVTKWRTGFFSRPGVFVSSLSLNE